MFVTAVCTLFLVKLKGFGDLGGSKEGLGIHCVHVHQVSRFSLRTQTHFRLSLGSAGNTSAFAGYAV